MIEDAKTVSYSLHVAQRDKCDKPYWLHPQRVADAMETADEKIVAYLHDVVEDTTCTLADLRTRGYTDEVIEALDAITRRVLINPVTGERTPERYWEYIERCSHNDLARRVKIEDIVDNMRPERVPEDEAGKKEAESLTRKRYIPALDILRTTEDGED